MNDMHQGTRINETNNSGITKTRNEVASIPPLDDEEDAWTQTMPAPKGPRAVRKYNGKIPIGKSGMSIPYQVRSCIGESVLPKTAFDLSVKACKVSCLCVEVVRGRLPMRLLHGSVTTSCCERLEFMIELLQGATAECVDLHRKRFYAQPVPALVDGMVVAPTKFEFTLKLVIGPVTYWVNLIFELQGSAWRCTYLDLG